MQHHAHYFSLLLFACLRLSAGDENFCNKNKKFSSQPGLYLRKPNFVHIVYTERVAYMHCCASGYDAIEWYVNGTRITKEMNLTTFTPVSTQDNTTITSRSVKESDIGKYTCIVRNSTSSCQASIKLIVKVKYRQHLQPMWVLQPQEEQCGKVGDPLLVDCLAAVGDEKSSQIYWFKDEIENRFLNSPKDDGTRPGIDITCYNKTEVINNTLHLTIGAKLYFPELWPEHFGNYTCAASFLNKSIQTTIVLKEGLSCKEKYLEQRETAYVIIIISLIIFTVLFVCMSAFVILWKLEIQLFLRNHFGRLEDRDDKLYDVFVCYDPEDADFTKNVLVSTLEGTYQYNCFVYERDSTGGEIIPETFSKQVRASRRFIMVLSQSMALNTWCTFSLYMAIKSVLESHSKIICIILQDICWSNIAARRGNGNDKILKQILKVVTKVYWEPGPLIEKYSFMENKKINICKIHGGSSKFWKSILIHLPLKHYESEESKKILNYKNFDFQC